MDHRRATDHAVQLYGDALCPKPVIKKKTEITETPETTQRFGILRHKMISAEFDINLYLVAELYQLIRVKSWISHSRNARRRASVHADGDGAGDNPLLEHTTGK